VALLLKDRDGPPEAGSPPPGGGAPFVAPDFACHACGGAMKTGQDWCLECGTAAPGRLGAKPGWRAAFTVVAVVLLLVSGATLAGYAALTTDAERTAAAPSAGDGTPIPGGSDAAPAVVTPPPVVQPGATGPGTTPPTVTPPPVTPPAQPIVPVQPPPPAKNTQVTPPAVTPPPPAATTGTGKTDTTGTDSTAAAAPKPEVAKLAEDSAATYDPLKRAGAEFGPAENAVDKSGATVWDVTVPADGKPIAAGLTVDLGKLYSLRALKISTPTPGFEVEVYGAVSAKPADLPEDILDKRWEHLTTIKSVVDDKLVSLLNKSKKQQQLLLFYITKPKDLTDPRVAIGKITIAGVPADETAADTTP
jgi:hypothetical protein